MVSRTDRKNLVQAYAQTPLGTHIHSDAQPVDPSLIDNDPNYNVVPAGSDYRWFDLKTADTPTYEQSLKYELQGDSNDPPHVFTDLFIELGLIVDKTTGTPVFDVKQWGLYSLINEIRIQHDGRTIHRYTGNSLILQEMMYPSGVASRKTWGAVSSSDINDGTLTRFRVCIPFARLNERKQLPFSGFADSDKPLIITLKLNTPAHMFTVTSGTLSDPTFQYLNVTCRGRYLDEATYDAFKEDSYADHSVVDSDGRVDTITGYKHITPYIEPLTEETIATGATEHSFKFKQDRAVGGILFFLQSQTDVTAASTYAGEPVLPTVAEMITLIDTVNIVREAAPGVPKLNKTFTAEEFFYEYMPEVTRQNIDNGPYPVGGHLLSKFDGNAKAAFAEFNPHQENVTITVKFNSALGGVYKGFPFLVRNNAVYLGADSGVYTSETVENF